MTKSVLAADVADVPISGRVFSDIYFPAAQTSTSGYRQNSASLWLQGDPHLGENSFSRFILTGDAIQNSSVSSIGGAGSQFRVGLREGYVGYVRNGLEFRIGQQIIPWGKSDVYNPTDYLTAKDYTIFNPDDEVRRLGSVSVFAAWTPNQGNSPFTFTFVAAPVLAQSKILVPPSSVPTLPAGITLSANTQLPPQTLGNTETAVKMSYAASRWDFSLSAFRGFNHTPEFAILSTTTDPTTGLPTAIVIGQTYNPIHALGGDFSLTSGKWVFRAESAYFWTKNSNGLNPVIQPSHWDSVLGVERPLGGDFRIQGQLVYRVYPLWSAAADARGDNPLSTQVRQAIAATNALLLQYQSANRPGGTLRVSYTNDSNGIDAEIFTFLNVPDGDFVIQPKFGYHWTDSLLTTAGALIYGGPTDRPFGALHVFNSVFCEGKYSF